MSKRIVRLAPKLTFTTVAFIAAIGMAIALEPRAARAVTLGNLDHGGLAAAYVATVLFAVRMLTIIGASDRFDGRVDVHPNSSRARVTAAAVASLLAEGVLFAMVGALALGSWALAAVGSVLLRLTASTISTSASRQPANRAICESVIAGLGLGMLLAAGREITPGFEAGSLVDHIGDATTVGLMLATASLCLGIEWGLHFERYFDAYGDRAWTWWMLWPSMGVMGIIALVAKQYVTWAVLALIVIAMFTIIGHALVMGQRSKPDMESTAWPRRGDAPNGPLRSAVAGAPLATGTLAYFVLAAAAIAMLLG